MNIQRLLSLGLLLLGASLAFAADEKQGGKSGENKSPPATTVNTPALTTPVKKANEVAKELPRASPQPGAQSSSDALKPTTSSSPLSKDKDSEGFMFLMTCIIVLAICGLYVFVWHRTHVPTHDVHHVHTGTSSTVDPKVVAAEVVKGMAVNPALSKIAAISNVERIVMALQASLTSMQQTLPQAAGKAAADEVSKSQVGDLKEKLNELQRQLDTATSQALVNRDAFEKATAAATDADRARHQAVSDLGTANAALQGSQTREAQLRQELDAKDRALQSATAAATDADRARNQAVSDLGTANAALQGAQTREAQLRQELDAKDRTLQLARDDVQSTQRLCQEVKNELQLTLEVNIPTGISDPQLMAQMKALHREAIQGNSSSVIAWATLTAFAAADTDPASKDFLLHVLKRLGLVLVSHWKTQEASIAKDRHEKLSHWAKCLTEHAQGRFSLIVPPLGAPVNRVSMATAANATIVQEVLTWQVRNPAGATFSLAEIA